MLEIVCCTPEDVLIATEAGATQIELCMAIELGGLTPTPGLVHEARRMTSLPVYAMVRPRPGNFCCSDSDFNIVRTDADALLSAGAHGLIFGFLRPDRTLDLPRMRLISNIVDEGQAICHRAFDHTRDLSESLEQLIDLGFKRVLTSGGPGSAEENLPSLEKLNEQAGCRIEILPGGGVRPHNANAILATGIPRLHAAPRRSHPDDPTQMIVDAEMVRQLVNALGAGTLAK